MLATAAADMHEIPLITTIALALSAALLFGLIVRRLGLSPIVGYLIAGVLIGPYTPGVVGDAKIASELAEIGVILLMFGVGLHFSFKDLLAVRCDRNPRCARAKHRSHSRLRWPSPWRSAGRGRAA